MPSKVIIIVIEFIFLGINIFWALRRAHFNPPLTARAEVVSKHINVLEDNAPIKSKLQHPPPPGKLRAFELLKIGSFKFPPPRAKMVFKCPPIVGFCLTNAPPKE